MEAKPLKQCIRAKAICVFLNQNRILVGDGYDPHRKEWFYCPPGGGVEFGELSEVALRREIREELGFELENPVLLGVLENIFSFDGSPGHEIVFVYNAGLAEKSLYEADGFKAVESNGEPYNAIWLDLDHIGPQTPPVFPVGLIQLLKSQS